MSCSTRMTPSSDAARSKEKQAYEVQSAFVDETGIGKKPDPFFMFMLHCAAYPVRYTKGPSISH